MSAGPFCRWTLSLDDDDNDRNDIPAAVLTFPGSGNTDRLLEILSYVWAIDGH